MIVTIIILIIYLFVGYTIVSIENNINGGDKFELFDVFYTIFWLPMQFLNVEKIYYFFKKMKNKK